MSVERAPAGEEAPIRFGLGQAAWRLEETQMPLTPAPVWAATAAGARG